jgi:6-phosphogluconate dehydrogenase
MSNGSKVKSLTVSQSNPPHPKTQEDKHMQIGFIGLGKMGYRMAGKLATDGHQIVVWNRTTETAQKFASQYKSTSADTVEQLVGMLSAPKIVWLMLPAGTATESMLTRITPLLNSNDIIIDGGNAHFSETQARFEHFKQKGIRFLGIGVSGGIIAEKEGYPIMVGGDQSAYEEIKPILKSLSLPHGGYEYFGEGGAGHFIKMIHNGIEYGIMQSLGEGYEVLTKAPYQFDLQKVTALWQKGTLVSGFMLDRVAEAISADPTLREVDGVIAASGEANWTVDQATKEGVEVDIIKRSLEYRTRSQVDSNVASSYTAKLVAALRHAFGGHELKKK